MTIPYFPQVIRGAEAAARKKDYSLIAVNSDDDGKRQTELLSLLRSQRVEGILLVVAAAPAPLEQISRILEAEIPVVCLDRIPDRVRVDSVSVDDAAAAEMGVRHLIEMGARRIALVTGPMALKNERRRLQGYRKALADAGIAEDEALIWSGNLRMEDVAALCRERIADAKSRPDAIFSTNGPTALGVLRAFRDLGVETPRDIAFATFDELTVADLFTPSITTVVQPAYEIGHRATELLLERLESGPATDEPATVKLQATLKVRESSRVRATS